MSVHVNWVSVRANSKIIDTKKWNNISPWLRLEWHVLKPGSLAWIEFSTIKIGNCEHYAFAQWNKTLWSVYQPSASNSVGRYIFPNKFCLLNFAFLMLKLYRMLEKTMKISIKLSRLDMFRLLCQWNMHSFDRMVHALITCNDFKIQLCMLWKINIKLQCICSTIFDEYIICTAFDQATEFERICLTFKKLQASMYGITHKGTYYVCIKHLMKMKSLFSIGNR